MGKANTEAEPINGASLPPDTWMTWANLVTILRAITGTVAFAIAFHEQSETWNYIGLGIYWVLDIVDGALARLFDQETRIGAQLDIHSDRMLVVFFLFNFLMFRPDTLVPVLLFMFNFVVLDCYLSNQFLRWPIRSPNYFYEVDRTIWKYNWSSVAKGLNSGAVILLLIFTNLIVLPSILCGIVIVEKSYSLLRLHQIPHPELDFGPIKRSTETG